MNIKPRYCDEITGEKALAILKWMEKETAYMEHGPNEDRDKYWPNKEDYVGLTLIEYALTRMEEEK